jgi:hypothetical protein
MKLDAVTLSALVMAFAWTMAFAGLKKHALELRQRARRCPSCGRRIDGRVCNAHEN